MNKVCCLPALFELDFAGGCVGGGSAGGGIAMSAGDTSVVLKDLLVNPSVNGWSWSHSGNSVSNSLVVVAHSSCVLRVIQSFGLVVGCLHGWDHQGNEVLGFTFDVLPFLMRYDG